MSRGNMSRSVFGVFATTVSKCAPSADSQGAVRSKNVHGCEQVVVCPWPSVVLNIWPCASVETPSASSPPSVRTARADDSEQHRACQLDGGLTNSPVVG